MSTDRGIWHSYAGAGIDVSVLHDQANARMMDKREPWSSVVHLHPSDAGCVGHEHSLYDRHKHQVRHNVVARKGHEIWDGSFDPVEGAAGVPMTENWKRETLP